MWLNDGNVSQLPYPSIPTHPCTLGRLLNDKHCMKFWAHVPCKYDGFLLMLVGVAFVALGLLPRE